MGSMYNTPLNIPPSRSCCPAVQPYPKARCENCGREWLLVGCCGDILLAGCNRYQGLQPQHTIVWGLWLVMLRVGLWCLLAVTIGVRRLRVMGWWVVTITTRPSSRIVHGIVSRLHIAIGVHNARVRIPDRRVARGAWHVIGTARTLRRRTLELRINNWLRRVSRHGALVPRLAFCLPGGDHRRALMVVGDLVGSVWVGRLLKANLRGLGMRLLCACLDCEVGF